MKRGKDDGKIMGPLFPRLHVNDTEKGGPRAPPRNKMALYEQLSIPTQGFNPGVLPLNSSNTSSLVPPGSPSQGNSFERNIHFRHPVHPSTSSHLAEKLHPRQAAGATLNTPLPNHEQRKKVGDEDDFAVPVFVQSGMGQSCSKSQNDVDVGNLSPLSRTYTGQSTKFQNVCDENQKQSSSSGLSLRQEAMHQSQRNPKICISDPPVKSSLKLSTREKIDELVNEVGALSNHLCGDMPGSNFSRLMDSDACLRIEFRTGLLSNDCGHGDGREPTRYIEKGVVSQPGNYSHSRVDCSNPNEPDNDSRCHGDRSCGSLQLQSGDESDDVPETSMVDSISGLDISPDDVVEIIGQKYFWKARRAIANQQRVFAVQVFELHRLIEVQRLMAGSPHLLLADAAYLGKPSLRPSPAKRISSEYVVKPLPQAVKRKDESEKINHKMECSAENAVGKTSFSSVKNGNQPSNYGSYLANQPPAPVPNESRMDPWCFHQSPGQQWLIPIMSPSEGLIYKPYPVPAFMGTPCGGGCAPFGPTPLTSNFMNPAYRIPSPLPHQGIGLMPGTYPFCHSYFPPYGMPVMNPSVSGSAAEQKSQFAGPGSHSQHSQRRSNFSLHHESSCNVPAHKNGAIEQGRQYEASKDTELQGSTASSPGERVQQNGVGHAAEGRDALPGFNMAPVVPEAAPQPHDTDQPAKVIKVVPHNPRSATESAARIFQSIQKERNQYDSI